MVEGQIIESYSIESCLSYDDRDIFKYDVEDNVDCTLGQQSKDRVDNIHRQTTSGNRHEKGLCKWFADALEPIKNHPLTSQIIQEDMVEHFIVPHKGYLNAVKINGPEDEHWFADRRTENYLSEHFTEK